MVERVDIELFGTLTGEDLIDLKITAFGARKRLLLAIKQMKDFQQNLLSNKWPKLFDYNDIPSLFTYIEMNHQIGLSINFYKLV